jgi:hypothetical protein
MDVFLIHNHHQQPGGEDVVVRVEEELLTLHARASHAKSARQD